MNGLIIGNLSLPARHAPEAKPMAGGEIGISPEYYLFWRRRIARNKPDFCRIVLWPSPYQNPCACRASASEKTSAPRPAEFLPKVRSALYRSPDAWTF